MSEYLTIKMDVGLLMKKLEEWKLDKQNNPTNTDDSIVLNAGLNEQKNADNHPLYRGKNVAVWHNKGDSKPETNDPSV